MIRPRAPSPIASPIPETSGSTSSSETSEDDEPIRIVSQIGARASREQRQNALRGVFELLLRLRPDVQALARSSAAPASGPQLTLLDTAFSSKVFAGLRTVIVDDFSMALLLPYLSMLAPAIDQISISAHHSGSGFVFSMDELRDAHAAFSYLAKISDRPSHRFRKQLRSLIIDGFGPQWIVTLLRRWDVTVNQLELYSYVSGWEANDEEVVEAIINIASDDLYLHSNRKSLRSLSKAVWMATIQREKMYGRRF